MTSSKLDGALVLVVVLPLVACAGGAPPPEDDPAGTGTTAGTEEADASVGPPADSGTTAPGRDAGAGVDGARDTTGAADAGSAPASNAPSGSANCAMLHFCEGFESYAAGSMPGAPWTRSTGGGATMKVDGTRPFGGTKSLHITAPTGPYSHATISQKVGPAVPIAGATLYGRVMFFFNDQAPYDLPKGSVHSWIFNVSGTSAALGAVSMNLGGWGVPKVMLNYHWPKREDAKQGAPWKAGAWHCLQWQYDGSGTPPRDEARVWVDGALAVDVLGATGGGSGITGWSQAPPWTAIDLGFTHYQTLTNQVEVWLDDFALDSSMVACPGAK